MRIIKNTDYRVPGCYSMINLGTFKHQKYIIHMSYIMKVIGSRLGLLAQKGAAGGDRTGENNKKESDISSTNQPGEKILFTS